MAIYQIISLVGTNALRLGFGLWLVARPLQAESSRLGRVAPAAALLGGGLVTILQAAGMPAVCHLGFECALLAGCALWAQAKPWNLCLFLAFFYELAVGLWDFLAGAWLGILWDDPGFVTPGCVRQLIPVWLVRVAIAVIALVLVRQPKQGTGRMPLVSGVSVAGFIAAVSVSAQNRLPLPADTIDRWVLFALILLLSLLFYRLNRQRAMEQEIAALKQAQAEIVERDYRALRKTYADNAKLYHDLHNHIEAIYQCLAQGDPAEAKRYCAALRAPVHEMAHSFWTGDKAVDYLISSKVALAEQMHIRTSLNIEYPHNTNIRSVDLTAILGNLLDNALEAADTAPKPRRFLVLTIRRINAMLVIKVENGYGQPPAVQDGALQTAKPDKVHHGWGLKSVRDAAERYEGTVTTTYADGVFRAVVTLFFEAIQTE